MQIAVVGVAGSIRRFGLKRDTPALWRGFYFVEAVVLLRYSTFQSFDVEIHPGKRAVIGHLALGHFVAAILLLQRSGEGVVVA